MGRRVWRARRARARIQGLSLLASFVAARSGFVLLSSRHYMPLPIANLGALAPNIVLTLVLVPLDRARGAAIAAVVAES